MFLNKELIDWDNQDVCNWLHNRNLRHHIETFEKSNINGYDMCYLTKEELKTEFKIPSFHERITIMKEIRRLAISHLKINISYENSESLQMSLDLDLETSLFSLISYFKKFSKESNQSTESESNIIILDNEQEILSPNCKIVELILLNPTKYRNLSIKNGLSVKKLNNNFSNISKIYNSHENIYKEYESKPKYSQIIPINENNISYKNYPQNIDQEYLYNDSKLGPSVYNYRSESKDYNRYRDYKDYKENKHENEENISNTNNISRDIERDKDRDKDYSYYNKYLNKDTGTENFYNTASANYITKNEVKSPMNAKSKGKVGNNYYDGKHEAQIPSSSTDQIEYDEKNTYSNTNGKLSRFQSEKRIYRDEGRTTKNESNYPRETPVGLEKKPREHREQGEDERIETRKNQKSFKNTPIYNPVDDTFRPRNENSKNSNNYISEENYSTPSTTIKPKIAGNTNIPKSQRNFNEENNGNSGNIGTLHTKISSKNPNSNTIANSGISEHKINSKKKY